MLPNRRPRFPRPRLWHWLAGCLGLFVLTVLVVCGVPVWYVVAWVTREKPPDLDPRFTMQEFLLWGAVADVAFSPDGKYLAAGTRGSNDWRQPQMGGEVRLWEVATGTLVKTMPLEQWVTAISFSPDSKRLLVATSFLNTSRNAWHKPDQCVPGWVALLDVPDLRTHLTKEFKALVSDARYCPDGKRIGVLQLWCKDLTGELLLLDAETLQQKDQLADRAPLMRPFGFTPDGKSALLCFVDDGKSGSRFRLYDLETCLGDTLFVDRPGDMAFAPDGKEVINIFRQSYLTCNLRTNKFRWSEVPGAEPGDLTTGVCYTPDHVGLLFTVKWGSSPNSHSRFIFQDRKTGQWTRIYRGQHNAQFDCCACAPDSAHYAVGTHAYRDTPEARFRGRVLLFTKK